MIRLAAVLLAVETLVTLPTAWAWVGPTEMGLGWKGGLIGFGGAMFSLAALLWIYPGMLARIAAARATEQLFESPLSGEELQYIALAAMGVWFTMGGIVDFVGVGMRIILATHVGTGIGLGDVVMHDLGRVVAVIVKVALGIGLALGARGLVGVLHRIRYQGLPLEAMSPERSGDTADPSP